MKIIIHSCFSLLLLLTIRCSPKENEIAKASIQVKQRLFHFTIDTAEKKPIVRESDNGQQGLIILASDDTLYYRFGYTIYTLAENDPVVVVATSKADTTYYTSTYEAIQQRVVFVRKPNYDIDRIRRQNVFFDTVDGYTAKLTLPRVVGNGGIVGMYIDSLSADSGEDFKFSMFGRGKDSMTNAALLKLFKTIKFTLER
jgi:hypothetical protein